MDNTAEKQVIKIDKILVSVDTDVYQAYYKMERRERYLLEAEQKHGVQYYSSIDNQDFLGEELLIDRSQNVEDIVLNTIDKEKLLNALLALTESERELITAIYFHEKSERVLATFLGVYQYAVHKKKREF